MYKALETGQVSPELTKLLEKMGPPEANQVGADGKPVVDSEGGATV